MSHPKLSLSPEVSLVYVRQESGCHGQLTGGTIERVAPNKIKVYDAYGTFFEYLSGDALRSWCVIDVHGMTLEDWSAVQPEDVDDVAAYALGQNEETSSPIISEASPEPDLISHAQPY